MGSQADALVALPWDTKAEYIVIAQITSHLKRAQTKSKKKPAQPIITQDPDLIENQEGLITPQCNSQEEMGTHYEYPLDASGVFYATTVQALKKRLPQATQEQDQSHNPAREEPQRSRRKLTTRVALNPKHAPYYKDDARKAQPPKKGSLNDTNDTGGPTLKGPTNT
ncbi:hypothetical protein DSO57_1033971 [Entomophthora muscae]|uniref:Uncharacterized protein n=1 Tax=Entomophthora muscae TaxID=34485 RepID=A0ACC2RR05_9FUNG|nr:hypothetical protein DSO57_1033971 [Entomophthora muscae]